MKKFLSGVHAGLPVILGFVPVGIAYGMMARQANLTALEAVLMSFLVFAGASQMMGSGLYAQGAGSPEIIFAAFLLNLRHVIMSACVMRRMEPAPRYLRLLLAFGVTDESFSIFTTEREENRSPAFFAGLFLSTYLSWAAGSAIGALAADVLPPALKAALGVSLYAMFLGLLLPHVRGNRKLLLLVLLTAGCNFALSQVMSSSWAMIVSTLLCAFVGVWTVDFGEDEQHAP